MAGQTVEIPLVGGQDTSAEPTIAATPQLMLNCTYDKQGGVKKRAGCTKKAHNPDDIAFGPIGSVVDPYRSRVWFGLSAPFDTRTLTLSPHRDSIVATGDCTQRVYDPVYNAWRTVDYAPTGYLADLIPVASVGSAYNRAFVSGGSMYQASNYPTFIANCDCAVNQSGFMAIVWVVVQGQPDGSGYRSTLYLRIIELSTGRDALPPTPLSSEDFTGVAPSPNKAARIVPYGGNGFLCIETNFAGGANCGLYSRTITQTGSGVRAWSYSTVVTNFGSSLVTGVGAGFNVGAFDVSAKAGSSNTRFVCAVMETSTQRLYVRTFTDANTGNSAITSYVVTDMALPAVAYDSAGYVWLNSSVTIDAGTNWAFVGNEDLTSINPFDSRLTNFGTGLGETTFGTVTGTDSMNDGSVLVLSTLPNTLTGTSNWQSWFNTGLVDGTPTASFGYGLKAWNLSRPAHYQEQFGKLYLSGAVTATSEYTRVASLVLPFAPAAFPSTMAAGLSAVVATETHVSTPKWVWLPPRQRSTSLLSEENNRRYFGSRTMSSYGGLPPVAMWQAFRFATGAFPANYGSLLPPHSHVYNGAAYSLVSTSGFDGFADNLFVAKQDFTVSGGTVNSVIMNETVFTSGGVVRGYDGTQSYEVGLAPPNLSSTATPVTGGATISAGDYGVAAVTKFTDANGNEIRSAPIFFETTSVTAGDALQVSWWYSTPMDEHLRTEIEIYITEAAGSVFYLVGSFVMGPESGTATATFATNPDPAAKQLYTVAGELDNVPPPGCRHLTLHQGRLVLCGTPTDDVWYSKEVLTGEIPAFNEGLTISPFEGGRVLGGASLDDYLVLFKEGGIYGVRGVFPDDTGNGGNLSPPFSIQKGLRLQDSASIITTALGVFFNTDRGIWILTRQGSVEPIGLPIREALGSATINAAVYDDSTALVMFFCSTGDVFAFDTVWKTWSTFVYKDASSNTLTFEAACIGADGKVYATDAAKRWLWDLSIGTSLDDGVFVPMKFKTGYVKSGASLSWQRVKRVGLRGRVTTDANVLLRVYYDYDEDNTESRGFVSDTMGDGSTGRECQMVPATQKCSSLSVEYSDAAPTGTGHSTGNGNGFVLQSMTLEIVPKAERRHLAPGKVK